MQEAVEVEEEELCGLTGRTIIAAHSGEGGFHIDLDDNTTIIVLLGAIVLRTNTTIQ